MNKVWTFFHEISNAFKGISDNWKTILKTIYFERIDMGQNNLRGKFSDVFDGISDVFKEISEGQNKENFQHIFACFIRNI